MSRNERLPAFAKPAPPGSSRARLTTPNRYAVLIGSPAPSSRLHLNEKNSPTSQSVMVSPAQSSPERCNCHPGSAGQRCMASAHHPQRRCHAHQGPGDCRADTHSRSLCRCRHPKGPAAPWPRPVDPDAHNCWQSRDFRAQTPTAGFDAHADFPAMDWRVSPVQHFAHKHKVIAVSPADRFDICNSKSKSF